jgi:DNA polymerase III subunit epsilon
VVKYALLMDTETTGLDPSVDRCIEVAAMLYDLEHGSPVISFSSLISGPEQNAAERVNRISPRVLLGAPPACDVWDRVRDLVVRADVLAAHRAEFDQKFCPDFGKPWVCTKVDFDWPGVARGDHLTHLALAYGLGIVSVHRAMADVDTMARILTRVKELGHDLQALFERAMRPKKKFVAMVSYDQRQLAKDAGFLWDGASWYRHMPPEDAEALPFRVREEFCLKVSR